MPSTPTLVRGTDTFTLLDLLKKAAAYKGLKLRDGASQAFSETLKTYELNEHLLAMLAERGIKRQARPDTGNHIFTLVDENPQEKAPGYAVSDYWNFKLLVGNNKFDLRVSLQVGFMINREERGIVLQRYAYGRFVSPADRLPHLRMFKALTEADEEALPVAKELAASDRDIAVTWTDLGLGGIRNLGELLHEFSNGKKEILELAGHHKVLNPDPCASYQHPGDAIFIAEPAQPSVFRCWREQLKEYRARLAV